MIVLRSVLPNLALIVAFVLILLCLFAGTQRQILPQVSIPTVSRTRPTE